MLSINLLPVREKNIILLEDARRIIRFFAILFSGVLVIGTSLLTPSYFPLAFERRELERSLAFGEEASKTFEVDKIKNLANLVGLSLDSVRKYSSGTEKASSIL